MNLQSYLEGGNLEVVLVVEHTVEIAVPIDTVCLEGKNSSLVVWE